jgi:hypothetical protein
MNKKEANNLYFSYYSIAFKIDFKISENKLTKLISICLRYVYIIRDLRSYLCAKCDTREWRGCAKIIFARNSRLCGRRTQIRNKEGNQLLQVRIKNNRFPGYISPPDMDADRLFFWSGSTYAFSPLLFFVDTKNQCFPPGFTWPGLSLESGQVRIWL